VVHPITGKTRRFANDSEKVVTWSNFFRNCDDSNVLTPLGGAAQPLSLFTAAASGREAKGVLGLDRLSERRACLLLGQHRSTQQRKRHVADDEPRLVTRIVWLACEYGRYGSLE
jgi:hypothetical protein